MVSTFVRCFLAALPIGLVGWVAQPWLAGLNHGSVFLRAGALLLVISGAVSLFLVASWALKIEGFGEFVEILQRKLKRRVKS